MEVVMIDGCDQEVNFYSKLLPACHTLSLRPTYIEYHQYFLLIPCELVNGSHMFHSTDLVSYFLSHPWKTENSACMCS